MISGWPIGAWEQDRPNGRQSRVVSCLFCRHEAAPPILGDKSTFSIIEGARAGANMVVG